MTDILTIHVNKVGVSDRVSCSNGKGWWYIVGYQVDGKRIIPLLIKTPNNVFSYDISQYGKNLYNVIQCL